MAPSVGTGGLPGLVSELTDDLVADYVHAFLSTLDNCETLYVGCDLRPSSPDIAAVICRVAEQAGGMLSIVARLEHQPWHWRQWRAEAAAIMVTGSHIPADRNGLKFYLPDGDILKADETAINVVYGERKRFDGAGGQL